MQDSIHHFPNPHIKVQRKEWKNRYEASEVSYTSNKVLPQASLDNSKLKPKANATKKEDDTTLKMKHKP